MHGNTYFKSDCAACGGHQEEVHLEKTIVRNVFLSDYEQLKTLVYDTRKQLQLSLKNRNQFPKKSSKYD
jgi:hypothetical protein